MVMKITTPLFVLLIATIQLISCNNYGDKVAKDDVEIYYKDNITKEQAQQTLEFIHPSWNEPGNKKSVQLAKPADTVYFRMVINEEKAKDVKDESYLLLANEISINIFNGSPVNVDLTNNNFKTIRTLHFKKMETENYGTKISSGNIDVYAKENFNEEEARKLAEFLNRVDGDGSDTKSFQAYTDESGVYSINMVSNREKSSVVTEQEFYDLAALLSDSVFNGNSLVLHLTDNTFKPYQSFKHK